jgi:hypothetical protein
MIEIIQRRLNPRYYAGPIRINGHAKVSYKVDSSVDTEAIEKWVHRVEKVGFAFRRFPCRGMVEVLLVSGHPISGHVINGVLYVFDDQTVENISQIVMKLIRVIGDYPTGIGLYRVRFLISAELTKVHLEKEGSWFAFRDLDTEPREKPRRTKKVIVPDPSVN